MMVFLNGPFGVGKTTVARELVDLLPGALLFDPEPVGALVRNMLGEVEPATDFQDYRVWRALVVDVAHRLREAYPGRPLVIPMTIWRPDYFGTIIGGLREIDQAVVCVRLTASREMLVERIRGRPEAEGSHAWSLAHLDVCLTAATDPRFGVEIATDGRLPREIARSIASLLHADGESNS